MGVLAQIRFVCI